MALATNKGKEPSKAPAKVDHEAATNSLGINKAACRMPHALHSPPAEVWLQEEGKGRAIGPRRKQASTMTDDHEENTHLPD
ncbi:unnamed protein product [Penicillium camemberti]|uniref:Str. FM013 n=1 Tax=Penicillium camemberti (strain FM 013) TaxID=1429867 RepID=A0A0G4PMT8_PENC3|nr:unnamed protein product [Penicillium camemberti]